MKKLLFLFTLSLLLVSLAWGQTQIHYNDCSSATSGWTFYSAGGLAVQQGGYWLVDNSGDYIISEAFDVTAFTDLTLDFKVATYGSGTANPCQVEYSTNGGTDWNTSTFTSATPSSKTYIDSGTWSLGTLNTSQLKLRWTRPAASGRGVRIDNIYLRGTPAAPNAPEATAGTSVNSDSFYANWDAVSGATGYYLDVYTKTAGTYATDLIISEYIEGSSSNKYIEVFNGTGTSVDLSNYKLELYSNGASTATNSVTLSGSLDHDAAIVYKNGSATLTLPSGVTATTNSAVNFNGDDAVALYKISTDTFVDIFGMIGQDPGSAWTGDGGYTTVNKTLVRKSTVAQGVSVNPSGYSNNDTSAFETLTTEWDLYDEDTATYLGSHTMAGGGSVSYITGYQNNNVSNVTSFEVTGLDPETTYYYVVRAYDAYAQTSSSSNEIEVTTTAAYDYPEDTEIDAGDVLIEISGGNGTIVPGTPTAVPNTGFTPTFEQIIELTGDGPWNVTVFSLDEWVACLFDGTWLVEEVPHEDPGAGYVYFWLELPGGKNTTIELKSGNGGNPTLPVELSTFTVALNNYNNAVLTWVTQTETGVSGFYVFRNTEESLATAEMVSNLIPATNTSQQQVYLFTDKELGGPGTYYYWLQVSDMDGSDSFYGPITLVYQGGNEPGIPSIPQVTELKSIYPNPFNPSATISYGLAEAADVKVQIFNSRGQLVRSYNEGQRNAGNYNLIWNGTDNNGQSQPTGVYFVRLHAGKKVFNSKAVLMK